MAKVYFCEKLRASTWDKDICKKRQKLAFNYEMQYGRVPSSFWPCMGCTDELKVLRKAVKKKRRRVA